MSPKRPPKRLTTKQLRFIAFYAGNAADAARRAGYQGTDDSLSTCGRKLLADPRIAEAIRARQEAEDAPHIASRQERQAFWTRTMKNVQAALSDRLRASELLGKSEGDFIERHRHEGTLTLEQLVLAAQPQVLATPTFPTKIHLDPPEPSEPAEPFPPEEKV